MLVETTAEQDARDDTTAAIDLCNGLTHDFDTRLLLLADDPRAPQVFPDAVQLWRGNPDLTGELRARFEIMRPDIVHTHRWEELVVAGHAARQAGVPQIVHTVCTDIGSAGDWQLDEFAALTERLAPLLIAPNEELAELLSPRVRVEIVPMGVDCARYVPGDQARARRKTGLPLEPKIIGCASPAANIETLFHALFRMDSEIHLALFGQAIPGPAERGLIRRLGLGERVHMLGAWAKPELVFQSLDVYFHGPSKSCLPRAVLAAQACGKPAVACAPSPSNVLCPSTGRLVPMQFMPTLLHSLQRTLASADPETTRRFIVENWSAERSLEEHAALFHRLAGQDQPNRRLA